MDADAGYAAKTRADGNARLDTGATGRAAAGWGTGLAG
jgi:hypothetical protein